MWELKYWCKSKKILQYSLADLDLTGPDPSWITLKTPKNL